MLTDHFYLLLVALNGTNYPNVLVTTLLLVFYHHLAHNALPGSVQCLSAKPGNTTQLLQGFNSQPVILL